MRVRDAAESDLPAILAIYNRVIATSTAVFSEAEVTLENRRAWFRGRVEAGYPVLAAADGSELVGFGALGPFRVGDGYRLTVEHSVHVREDRRGEGVGTRLMLELIERAEASGRRSMIAGMDAANAASIRLHERLGFEHAALLPDVAEKFGRRLDLLLMRRRLSG